MHRVSRKDSQTDTALVEALCAPEAFDHPVDSVELIETHISWVILTDEYAYKVKKPLELGFLDFSTLEKRRFFCREEIRLNKRWAPQIYLDVVAVTDDGSGPRFGGNGRVIEYAVRMRRFDDGQRLDRELDRGTLTAADMRELGEAIAARHEQAPAAEPHDRKRLIAATESLMRDNFDALEGFAGPGRLEKLSRWTERELERCHDHIRRRFDDGFFRDCHGDLHLENLVRLPDGIAAFDCIEFNADLRLIDVICDIAFLVMDLIARRREDLAARFLNRYLERTGDYAGVDLLNVYVAYRSLVRAKVAAIRSGECVDGDEQAAELEEAHSYCDLAERRTVKSAAMLVIMHGLSGSGKTRVSDELVGLLPAIRIRSDIERKRMFGIEESTSSHSGTGTGIYTDESSRAVYARLVECARPMLESGHTIILDAAFLRDWQRNAALQLAHDLDIPAVIVAVDAPIPVLRERISKRAQSGLNASEANLAVLEHQLISRDPFSEQENRFILSCDNSSNIDAEKLCAAVRSAGKRRAV